MRTAWQAGEDEAGSYKSCERIWILLEGLRGAIAGLQLEERLNQMCVLEQEFFRCKID